MMKNSIKVKRGKCVKQIAQTFENVVLAAKGIQAYPDRAQLFLQIKNSCFQFKVIFLVTNNCVKMRN